MANFESPTVPDPIKMMVLGDTGSGKTGALASLLAGGYNVRVLDFERGIDVLKDFLLNPASIYTKAGPRGLWTADQATSAVQRLRFETLMDSKRAMGGDIAAGGATAWQRAVRLLENWKTSEDNFGPITRWTTSDILVVDTLSFAAKRVIDFNMAMNSNLGKMPTFNRDYRPAQFHIENLLGLLYDSSVKCNVIVNCHIAWHTEQPPATNRDGEPAMTANNQFSTNRRGYPDTVGQALWLKIGRYFNNVVQTKTVSANTRIISTSNDLNLEMLKTSAPLRVKRQYSIDTGLLELFRDLGAATPTQALAPAEAAG